MLGRMNLQSVPILIRPDLDKVALAAANGRPVDNLRNAALAVLGALCFGLLAVILVGCTPAQQLALESAASVGQGVACAICGKPLPAPPAVPKEPSPADLIGLAAWAASVETRMNDIERAVMEEMKRIADGPKVPAPVTADRSAVGVQ